MPEDRREQREFSVNSAGRSRFFLTHDPGGVQFDLYQTPYFLKLLCDQIGSTGDLPKGGAGLFTGFVRKALLREIDGKLFQPGALLNDRDHRKLSRQDWRDPFDLPQRGLLIPTLSDLAFRMQTSGMKNESAQVRIDRDDACNLIGSEHAEEILEAGLALNLLDEARDEITFPHQLLQEYFAARQLAKEPKPDLVHVEWSEEKVRPTLSETIAGLADGDPLPLLAQTGWEETTMTAAQMARDPEAFISDLILQNLPLAARCAASPKVKISGKLKVEIQQALIARTQDMKGDLRARISAGGALPVPTNAECPKVTINSSRSLPSPLCRRLDSFLLERLNPRRSDFN